MPGFQGFGGMDCPPRGFIDTLVIHEPRIDETFGDCLPGELLGVQAPSGRGLREGRPSPRSSPTAPGMAFQRAPLSHGMHRRL
jgi:hypothetical protein